MGKRIATLKEKKARTKKEVSGRGAIIQQTQQPRSSKNGKKGKKIYRRLWENNSSDDSRKLRPEL